MRHAKKRLQLNRFTSWHDATITSLAKSVIFHQSINTTLHRAKAARQMVEKLITLAKENTLFARRQAQKLIGEHKLVQLLFNEIGPRFSGRKGGFTRIISLGKRRGDNAQMVIFQLTEIKKKAPKKVKHAKEKAHPAQDTTQPEEEKNIIEGKAIEEKKQEPKTPAKERPAKEQKPQKKFLGGLRSIFKKERDSL